MGTILAKDILDRAATMLGDPTHVVYPWTDKLKWLNDAQREIVLVCPDASTKNEPVQLTAGATKQTIPAAGIKFLKLIRNMGADGAAPGDIIDSVAEAEMNQRRGWHTATPATSIMHYIEIPNDNRNYYVYPPVHASTDVYVEILYSCAPADVVISGLELTDLASSTAVISLDDIYANAILYFVLARSFGSKLNKGKEDLARAADFESLFNKSLGLKQKGMSLSELKERTDG